MNEPKDKDNWVLVRIYKLLSFTKQDLQNYIDQRIKVIGIL